MAKNTARNAVKLPAHLLNASEKSSGASASKCLRIQNKSGHKGGRDRKQVTGPQERPHIGPETVNSVVFGQTYPHPPLK